MGLVAKSCAPGNGLVKPSVGIIGGTGRMGAWFGDLLKSSGSKVLRVGRKTRLSPVQAAKECDVVVISVPIVHTVEIIKEIAPLISEDRVLMDLTSIKKEPMEAMLKYSRSEVVGVHPLFGLDMEPDSEARVAVCPGRGEKGLAWLKDVLEKAGLTVGLFSPERHDQLMGLIQGVNHFATLALALLIRQSGFTLEEISDLSTQTFMRRIHRISAILGQSEELFESLLMDNSFTARFVEQYIETASDLERITKNRDRDRFKQLFLELKEDYFKDERNMD